MVDLVVDQFNKKQTIMKVLKRIALGIAILLVIFVGWMSTLFHSLPDGESGSKADEVAEKMLQSLNYSAYKRINTIRWTFRGKNHHNWNKKERTDKVRWGDVEVFLDFKSGNHSVIKSNYVR